MSEAQAATEQPKTARPVPAKAPVVDLQGKPLPPKKAKATKLRWGGELTISQQRFCQMVAGGARNWEAYRAAFNRPTMPKKTATRYGSLILAKPAAQAKVQQYMKQSDAPVLMTINDRLGLLSGFANDPLVKSGDRIRAIAVYTEIAGGNAPHQSEVLVATVAAQGGAQPVAGVQPSQRRSMAERIAGIRAARAARFTEILT
jgi:hypothetical protein